MGRHVPKSKSISISDGSVAALLATYPINYTVCLDMFGKNRMYSQFGEETFYESTKKTPKELQSYATKSGISLVRIPPASWELTSSLLPTPGTTVPRARFRVENPPKHPPDFESTPHLRKK